MVVLLSSMSMQHIPMRYMWSATDSGEFTLLFTHPVRFKRCTPHDPQHKRRTHRQRDMSAWVRTYIYIERERAAVCEETHFQAPTDAQELDRIQRLHTRRHRHYCRFSKL